ncbi:MAG: plasmid pRiA4b ORF-3 family protein [Cytophagales bacterium]|nr:plasmid pRiA4b ORF-3 family protein [Cytophagales bacterium]
MVYHIHVRLNTEPAVKRTVCLDSETDMDRVHHVIQAAMGWKNRHHYRFTQGNSVVSLPDKMSRPGERHAARTKLSDCLKSEGDALWYEYDFGDEWMHEIVLAKIVDDGEQEFPLCLNGNGACPPEEIGGVRGYQSVVKVLGNPKHPDYLAMKAYAGDSFDPDSFDVDAANEKLRELDVFISQAEKEKDF